MVDSKLKLNPNPDHINTSSYKPKGTRSKDLGGSRILIEPLLPRGSEGGGEARGGSLTYHDVHVEPVGAEADHPVGLRGEVGEVGREHRRRYLRRRRRHASCLTCSRTNSDGVIPMVLGGGVFGWRRE